jgi:hypothetical protein
MARLGSVPCSIRRAITSPLSVFLDHVAINVIYAAITAFSS